MIVIIDICRSFVKIAPMSDREKNILEAAVRVFSRYGVKRTSMGDIAEEAGISRQTLYKSFGNKNEILRAHIRDYTDNAVREMEDGLAEIDGLGPSLDLIFQKMTIAGFDMVRASPNTEDLIEGVNDSARKELEIAATRFQAVITGTLSPHAQALSQSDLSPEQLAEFIQRSARAAKSYARDRQHLQRQLHTLKQLCLDAVRPHPAEASTPIGNRREAG